MDTHELMMESHFMVVGFLPIMRKLIMKIYKIKKSATLKSKPLPGEREKPAKIKYAAFWRVRVILLFSLFR